METLEMMSGIVIVGAISSLALLGYQVRRNMNKVCENMNKVCESTTIVLDSFTAYAIPRVKTSEDIAALAELAKTRAEYNI